MLYKVKHLIEITPITLPDVMPEDKKNGFLKENGEFVTYNKLATHGDIGLTEVEADVEEVRRKNVDKVTMKRRLNLKWYDRW